MHPATTSETIASRFADCVRRAVAKDLSVVELISAADMMADCGEIALVKQLYKLWIEHNAEHPLLHAVNFNYGVVLSGSGDPAGARDAFLEAIRINPDFLPPYINLGTLLERAGHLDQAVTSWLSAVNRVPGINGDAVLHKATALKQLGRVFESVRDTKNAEDVLQKSLDINPHQRDVAQHWIALRQAQCKWPVIAPWGNVERKLLLQSISPLSLGAYSDDPMFQLANSYKYYTLEVAPKGPCTVGRWTPPETPRSRPLRVGYVSSDLREHAVGFLTSELFELHDRSKVEIFAYYCGPVANDATNARIKAAVDHWTDVTLLNDTQAAAQIVRDGIDILVDLNGYTKDARTKVFALRPAPIIVNWLGFPGSMGSPHHNYIIADDYIIPPALEPYYSERVLRLPCYQPNDRRRVVAEHRPSRAEAGLPETALVYCCFNGTQKITRFTFKRWMEILKRVPDAVLWLLTGGEVADAALRQHAVQHGVAAERLIFAPKMANPDHLARYPLADLFLDTSPYGAHTTASDAMWLGVPVLTTAGRGFASRVCGSLVRAAGLPELVCDDFDGYVARAVELGHDRARLKALKDKLVAGRDSCVLFDTQLLVRSLEALFERMWDAYAAGRLPEPDLANLEIYHDIGCEIDDERVELQAVADYERRYITALAYRHRVSAVRADARLWPRSAAAQVEEAIAA
jgi:predicted O-linked N-acetylglucosamine transferase (SPINDLY family)